MKLSVITVTYNNAIGLQQTIKSIVNQSCKDFEYIVVDGASKDNSVNIIKQNESYISKWVSEPDTGIYNAMNKAVRMATGDYCLFMNAGDELYSESTVEELYKIEFNEDFVEGVEYDLCRKCYSKPPKEPTLAFYLNKKNNRHQASLIKRELLLKEPYDETLRIASDLKFNIKNIILNGCSYLPISVIVAKYDGRGISRTIQHDNELKKIYSNFFPDRVLKDYDYLSFMYRFPSKYLHSLLQFLDRTYNTLKNLIKKK